jgi:hypothetical protein
LAGPIDTDVWSLLAVDTTNDARRIAAAHHDVDARLVTEPAPPWQLSSEDCLDIMYPYDFDSSQQWNVGPNGYNVCSAHGFTYAAAAESWRGSVGPPSSDNLQVRSSVLSVDEYGRATRVSLENDRYRLDDDLCVELTYAAPTGSNERVLTAVSKRRVWEYREAEAISFQRPVATSPLSSSPPYRRIQVAGTPTGQSFRST